MNSTQLSFNLNRMVFLLITILLAFPNQQEAKEPDKTPLDFTLKTLDGDEI